MQTVTDMMGREIRIPNHPKRIISLVPSQTELLADFGLDNEVVGITKFCVHPQRWFRTKTRIGGTKQVHFDKIKELQPDLIIANKEENEKSQIEQLAAHFPVWISDIYTLDDACSMIQQVGGLTGKPTQANHIAIQIVNSFEILTTERKRPKAAYFIWKEPYMVAAQDTFIDNILQKAGFKNAFAEYTRYPEINMKILAEKKPDVILLSSEPYPFKTIHIAGFQHICPQAKIEIVDGELFSWYGSRLLKSATYLEKLRIKIFDKQ